MVTNLIKRHPNCRVLLHRANVEECTLTSDPYDLEAPDPVDSHALESCLWELKVTQWGREGGREGGREVVWLQ